MNEDEAVNRSSTISDGYYNPYEKHFPTEPSPLEAAEPEHSAQYLHSEPDYEQESHLTHIAHQQAEESKSPLP